MASFALRIHLVVITLVSCLAAQTSTCSFLPTETKCVYARSADVATGELQGASGKSAFIVSLESPFFEGMYSIKTLHGVEFGRAGHSVAQYPESLSVLIESVASRYIEAPAVEVRVAPGSPPASWRVESSAKARDIPDVKPVRIVVKWIEGSDQVIDSKSGELRRMVEWWPENRPARVWYVADLSGIKAPLAARIDVTVIGNSDVELGTISGGFVPRQLSTSSAK